MPQGKLPKQPLLNPALTLCKDPNPTSPPNGGNKKKQIVKSRLKRQRGILSESLNKVFEKKQINAHAGQVHLSIEMFEDSYANSYVPYGIFNERLHSQLISSLKLGYAAEIKLSKIPELVNFIEVSQNIDSQVSISRIKNIRLFGIEDIWDGKTIDNIWEDALEQDNGRAFIIWLAPFRDADARKSVIGNLKNFKFISLDSHQEELYKQSVIVRSLIVIPDKKCLKELALSGSSFRIDPVKKVSLTAPGIGKEPTPPIITDDTLPIVAVIDGGLTAKSYSNLEAWRMPPLVPAYEADANHGNKVSSLLVHANEWNNQLNLPSTNCRIGIVQAIPKSGSRFICNPVNLINHLDKLANHHPDAQVWNLSFNEVSPQQDLVKVSFLGHKIRELARKYKILPVISIGNKNGSSSDQLCAPADCEAAITVGGRTKNILGQPSVADTMMLKGPGPDGMLKPDMSWFSELRVLGGNIEKGSSYSTPLVSALAAHCFKNLKDPSPDLVKALLINNCELEKHNNNLGWGTPWNNNTLPWLCSPETVSLVWKGKLKPGYQYYWDDIPIPEELTKEGKLFGEGHLTAILNPIVSELGCANYFLTRLQVALQYTAANGEMKNLLGPMKESIHEEKSARNEYNKWQPVRNHVRNFQKKNGLSFKERKFRLCARIFSRNLFELGVTKNDDLDSQEVVFVLTLKGRVGIYNSIMQQLGSHVESAIIEQNIESQQ
ncbi:S8 family peptidase [Zymomonas mobilis]|uniref:S8 family peptidase n=1 Tax=Zymomonas mobilis TaxID=542 RepID=UPI0021C277AC|nr:S8 family peptidase [Zymomonas mobilis]MCP9308730.1 S8 family peptidase [Zymomonas mobilis]